MHGKIIFDDEYDIYKLRSIYNHYKKIDLTDLRTKIGMIFQQPNPFPMSIRKNVAFSLKISGFKDRALTEKLVKKALKKANL
jgi:phosphate transport system ATP-binding protein